MSNQVTGKIIEIGTTVQVSDRFKKRDIVIEVQDGEYKNANALQLVQDKCELGDKFAIGQEVTISYNIRSNKPSDRWFTSLTAWRIEPVGSEATQTYESKEVAPEPIEKSSEGNIDGLPF